MKGYILWQRRLAAGCVAAMAIICLGCASSGESSMETGAWKETLQETIMQGESLQETVMQGESLQETVMQEEISQEAMQKESLQETVMQEDTLQETVQESLSEDLPAADEETSSEAAMEGEVGDDVAVLVEKGLPLGHRIIYADGEVFGWTQYQYDEKDRIMMTMFLSPLGQEYWSPVSYDGQGHVLPDLVGEWTHTEEHGWITEIGFYNTKGKEQLYARYEYDINGNLTDHWYMYVNGQFLRHQEFQYDPEHRLVREETYQVKGSKETSLSLIRYFYDEEGYLLRKQESGDTVENNLTVYTFYRYDEQGALIREEEMWGDTIHDYVDYIYDDQGKLIREFHYVENSMMGGSYTKEYIYRPDEVEIH